MKSNSDAFLFRKGKIRFTLQAEQVQAFASKFAFLLDEMPSGTACPIAVDAEMIGVPFEDFYTADAKIVQFRETKQKKLLKTAVKKLTGKRRFRITKTHSEVLLIWWASVKNSLKNKYPHVYSDSDEESEYAPLDILHEILLLLNDGKPQEKAGILKTETHAVLSALNARIEQAKK